MEQRKLMDNSSTVTDMAKTLNTTYEITSEMNGRQDILEEKVGALEEKLISIQGSLESLPDVISKCLQKHQETIDQKRLTSNSAANTLHPDMAARPQSYQSVSPSGSSRSPTLWLQHQQQQQIQQVPPPVFPRVCSSGTVTGTSSQHTERSPSIPPYSMMSSRSTDT